MKRAARCAIAAVRGDGGTGLVVLIATVLPILSWPVLSAEGGGEPQPVLEGGLALGVGHVDTGSYRFGRHSGLTFEGFTAIAELHLHVRPAPDSGDARYWDLTGLNLGQESRFVEARLGDAAQRLTFGFLGIPRNLTAETATPFAGAGSTQLTLPDSWVAQGNTTAGLTGLRDALGAASLRERRRRSTVDYRRHLPAGWQLTAGYRLDTRSGQQALGGVMGSTGGNARAVLLPVPLDHRTEVFDLALARQSRTYSLAIAYTGSFFQNRHDSVTWQNPFGAHPQWAAGAGYPLGSGRLALDPDNSFHQLALSGAWQLAARTRASLHASHGRMQQDQAFLPYTVNAQLPVLQPLPRDALDGRIDVTRLALDLSSRPSPRLQLTAAWRLDERDNRTPRSVWQAVQGDAQPQAALSAARLNRPYGYSENRVSAGADFRATRGLRLTGGIDHAVTRRDDQEVDRVVTNRYRGGLRFQRGSRGRLAIDYHHERRDAGTYVGNRPLTATRLPGTVDSDEFENHPLLRKYTLADRERDRVQARVDTEMTPSVHLGSTLALGRDDYRDSVFGLNQSETGSVTLDVTYTPGDAFTLTAFGTLDRYDSEQSGRSFNNTLAQVSDPGRDWSVGSDDRLMTFGVSLALPKLEGRWAWLDGRLKGRALSAGADVLHSRTRSTIDVRAGSALVVAPLPDLSSRLVHYRIHAEHALADDTSLQFAWIHERYRSRDFALDGTGVDTVASLITLGDSSPRYAINRFTLSYLKRF